ncbi:MULTISPECIES: SDR family NAD(P)-dependent oxidoreductase [unclassified Variovorax]|uniref:SDR family NAD(P)-dependent oxidoreductase n=1 Tax=unclassified Variovorax TaxID=663243 RepID=UPI003F44E9C2
MDAANSSSAETRCAVVTGAARGIGLAIAEQLARDGLRVVATDRDGEVVQAQAERLRAEGLAVQAAPLDVQDRAAVKALFAGLPSVEVVVNNAGVASAMIPFRELDAERLRHMMGVNLLGSFIVAQEAVRRMPSGGRVVQIASRGYLGGAGAAHYVASKAAVVGMVRAMAIELRWRGITVNAVAPGMVDTRMLEGYTPEMRRALEQREPAGAAASPRTIADAVSFLASAHAAQCNGQVLFVDGGKSVGMPPL